MATDMVMATGTVTASPETGNRFGIFHVLSCD